MRASYDLIGDVHGCGYSLEALLVKLGYSKKEGAYAHSSRKAVFLGDIIDRGPHIRKALNIVRGMVDHGFAYSVMGNHELNAMLYHTPANNIKGKKYLREHTPRNTQQLQATLKAYEKHQGEWADHLKWFMQLPLYLDFKDFRVVHACWDDLLINQFKSTSSNGCLNKEQLQKIADSSSFEFRLVETLLKGVSLTLPEGHVVKGADGYDRKTFRVKFWEPTPEKYSDVVFQPDRLPNELEEKMLSLQEKANLRQYKLSLPPLFVGHYWHHGVPACLTKNIACLDYSAVKAERLMCYRYDGEQELDNEKFLWVDTDRYDFN